MLLFFLLFSNLFFQIIGKYICVKNGTVHLEFNKIAFFETRDFPTLISKKESKSCRIKFKLKEQNYTDYRIIIGSTLNSYLPEPYDRAGTSTTLFVGRGGYLSFPSSYSDFFQSDQGFVLYDDGSDNCPLESLCNPFIFKDETQIIYLADNENYNLKKSCQWKFTSPKGYGFKVIIMQFDPFTKLLITNTTDVIVNTRSLKLNYPYYNDDNFIQIKWFNLPEFMDGDGIFVSVSIFKMRQKYSNAICKIIRIDNATKEWTNIFPPYNGLKNNQRCTYNLTIPSGYIIGVTTKNLNIEQNADLLQYYRSETDIVRISDYSKSDGIILQPNYDGIRKNVFFEFKSDGSFTSLGFTLKFIFLKCKCSKFIYCKASLDEQTIMGNDIRYCGNLHCFITIKPCSTGYGALQLTASYDDSTKFLDIFKVNSNDETMLQIDDSNRELSIFDTYLNSSNTNVLEVITAPSLLAGTFFVTYKPFKLPVLKFHHFLTSDFPYIILDMRLHRLAVIEVDNILKSKNLSMIVYRFAKFSIFFSIFNDESLKYNLGLSRTCFQSPYPYKCEIKRNKLALFRDEDNYLGEFVAVKLSETLDGCIFSETVFTTDDAGIVNITGIANSTGTCDIILFIEQKMHYLITSLWTTAKNENVKIFIGLDKTRLFFEFNSISAKNWHHIAIFSKSYIIQIPKNSALFLKLEENSGIRSDSTLKYPDQSLISTFDFGTLKLHHLETILYEYTCNVTLKFTAIFYDMPSNNLFYFLTSDEDGKNEKITPITKTGDSVTFYDPYIALIYNSTTRNAEAMFLVETIN